MERNRQTLWCESRDMVTVLLFAGSARHGKTTACEIVKAKLEAHKRRVLIINYADYLKFIAKEYCGWNGQKDEAGRTLLQWLGTDKIRANCPDFWVDAVVRVIEALQDEFDVVCIGDVRFPNEIQKMKFNKSIDPISIHIERLNFDNGLTPEQRKHPSENSLRYWDFDWYIKCESGVENLEREIDKMIEYYAL